MRIKFSLEKIALIALCIGISICFINLLVTGNVRAYVHPRMCKYMIISTVILLGIALFNSIHLYQPKHCVNLRPYYWSILPIIIISLLPKLDANQMRMEVAQSTNAQIYGGRAQMNGEIEERDEINENKEIDVSEEISGNKEAKEIGVSEEIRGNEEAKEIGVSEEMRGNEKAEGIGASEEMNGNEDVGEIDENEEMKQIEEESQQEEISNEKAKQKIKYQDGQCIEDEAFGYWLRELCAHPQEYKGKEFTIKGQVYRDETMKADEFVPTREVMTCCIADLQLYGIMSKSDQAQTLENGSWVLVTAEVALTDQEGEVVPMLLAKKVVPADPPTCQYVYWY